MSFRSTFLGVSLLSLCAACSRTARATDFYAGFHDGLAYLGNRHGPDIDSSGLGFATQLDLGSRATPEFAWHATFIADHSPWTWVDGSLRSDYETTLLGLGVGATFLWSRACLGVSTGGQFTWSPDVLEGADEPLASGLGPFFSVTAGYVFPRSEGVQLRAEVLARYRVGKDEEDPSGVHLGAGLSFALVEKSFEDPPSEERSPSVARSESTRSALSAHFGWWNAELELLVAPGMYVAVGGPWVAAFLGNAVTGPIPPFGARIGYQFAVGAEWKLRAAAHLVGLSDVSGTDSWLLFETGARYEAETGLVYGIDVPLLVLNDVLGLDNQPVTVDAYFAPPTSFALLQAYVGYSWPL